MSRLPYEKYLLLGVSQIALYNGHKDWLKELPSYKQYKDKENALAL